jgi:hypothetical protein
MSLRTIPQTDDRFATGVLQRRFNQARISLLAIISSMVVVVGLFAGSGTGLAFLGGSVLSTAIIAWWSAAG